MGPRFFRANIRSVARLISGLCLLGLVALVLTPTSNLPIDLGLFNALGVKATIKFDPLAQFMLALILGVGAAVFLYSSAYLNDAAKDYWALLKLTAFGAAMSGLVLAENLILFFVFWELTTVLSYFLVGFYHHEKAARVAAQTALLVSATGGLAMLIAFLLIGSVAGSYEFTEIELMSSSLIAHPSFPWILGLLLLGAFTKSAQFPFSFWLPGAMTAPAPVSAYLHSATMVKAGVFLLLRFVPVFSDTAFWHYALISVGTLTLVLGAIQALMAEDLKLMLAHSTVSALGSLVLLLGIGTTLAIKAALVFLVVHALYKASLFLGIGCVEKQTGSRALGELRGLRQVYPGLFWAVLVSGLSMCGLPPLLGFISKELVYEAKLQAPAFGYFMPSLGVLANVLLVGVGLTVALRPFLGKPTRTVEQASTQPLPRSLWLPPLGLGVFSLAGGLFPEPIANHLLEPALQVVKGVPTEIKLKLWHGINLVLLLSIATFGLGVIVFVYRSSLVSFVSRHAKVAVRPRGFDLFQGLLQSLLELFAHITKFIQNGSLNAYLAVTASVVSLLLGIAIWEGSSASPAPVELTHVWMPLAAAIMIAVAGGVLFSKSPIGAMLLLSSLGLATALLFVGFGAPDLALTQLLVDLLLLVTFVLVLDRLPSFRPETSKIEQIFDAGIAVLFGVGMACVTYSSIAPAGRLSGASEYYGAVAWLEAQGRNVVNVTLVDFRALDTLGEGVVIGLATFGVLVLSKRRQWLRNKE